MFLDHIKEYIYAKLSTRLGDGGEPQCTISYLRYVVYMANDYEFISVRCGLLVVGSNLLPFVIVNAFEVWLTIRF